MQRKKTIEKPRLANKGRHKTAWGEKVSKGTKKKFVSKEGKHKALSKARVANEITEEWSMGAKKFKWKSHIRNAKSSANNVMHFPRTIAKRCIRFKQKEIKMVDVDTKKVFTC
ncbi:unnamed protein product [Vicia faba]|uniref:Uncharacterized protein n=1 Tax=Vicia faba TaxID=3906 RepID=A0AAV1ADI3_VICFA|nr:unnamed protein product [Vicia faba]